MFFSSSAQNKVKKVALGMSGGVDSSVAAYLLLKQGYEVTGVFMECWDAKADGCKADEDRAYAVRTAGQLGIPFEHLDFKADYKAKVMNYFYVEYLSGRTPNPDVICNKEIKFGLFYDWAMARKFDYVATGHYARVRKNNDIYELLKGLDPKKDQSYFLYLLGQNQLEHTLFPVGSIHKSKIRELAMHLQLPSAERPDSMGICFIGNVDIKEFLQKQIEPKVGHVLDSAGNVIGQHEGAWFYTIGQRHGFGLTKYFGHPMYVLAKNVVTNTLTVGPESSAYTQEFSIEKPHWIAENPIAKSNTINSEVRIRHLGALHRAKVTADNDGLYVKLDKPIFAVAPGQSAVFYQGDKVLGGGIIK
jgi:tRNA-uridine 2-sulfurtransferase